MQMCAFSSDNTNDKASGSGALKVTAYYLDTNYVSRTEEITLNGTANVNTVATDILRINGFRVTAAGASGKPAGTLSLTSVGAGTTYGFISLGYTRARNSCYTVPAGKNLFIVSMHAAWGHTSAQPEYGRIYLRVNMNEGVKTAGIFYPYSEVFSENTTQPIDITPPLKVPEKCDIRVSCIASTAGAADVVLRGWLENNT
jgi:hypothetical protein